MKRILSICILLLTITTSHSFAQSYGGIVLDSKASFTAQVTNFDAFVTAGNITSANKSMDTLMMMMNKQVSYTQYYMNDRTVTGNPTLVSAANTKLTNKMNIKNKIQGYKSSPAVNKTKIDTELSNFMAIMD